MLIVINAVQLLVQSDGETYSSAHMIDTCSMIEYAIYVQNYGKVFLVFNF